MPTGFKPKTALPLPLQNDANVLNREQEDFTPRLDAEPTDDKLSEDGVPWSALNE